MLLVIFENGGLCSGMGRGRQKWAETGRNRQKKGRKQAVMNWNEQKQAEAGKIG